MTATPERVPARTLCVNPSFVATAAPAPSLVEQIGSSSHGDIDQAARLAAEIDSLNDALEIVGRQRELTLVDIDPVIRCMRALASTPATTVAGMAAKLRVALSTEATLDRKPSSHAEALAISALGDAERLAAEPGHFSK